MWIYQGVFGLIKDIIGAFVIRNSWKAWPRKLGQLFFPTSEIEKKRSYSGQTRIHFWPSKKAQ